MKSGTRYSKIRTITLRRTLIPSRGRSFVNRGNGYPENGIYTDRILMDSLTKVFTYGLTTQTVVFPNHRMENDIQVLPPSGQKTLETR